MHQLRLNRRQTLLLAAAACGKAAAQTARALHRIALIEGLSGPFANAGAAVFRNLLWTTERINELGGVKVSGAAAGDRALRQRRHHRKGARPAALGHRPGHRLRRAGQQLGCGRGVGRGPGQTQRARAAAARAAAELLGRRSDVDQRALQPVALPLRCACRHALGGIRRGAAAIGEAGVGAVYAVAEWHPNVGGAASDAFSAGFRKRFAEPRGDYVHLRRQALVERLAAASERACSAEAGAVSRALSGARFGANEVEMPTSCKMMKIE